MIKEKDIKTNIPLDYLDFLGLMSPRSLPGKTIVVDVETYGTDPKNGKLLGLSLCSIENPINPIYVALQWYDYKTSTWIKSNYYENAISFLKSHLATCSLIGHGYTYDKLWIDQFFNIDSKWVGCTRLMWHIASAPSGPRPYGLKDAQIEVLGWDKRGDYELEEQVKVRGGRLSNGDHYLADVGTLGHYACLDASSTSLLYASLSPFYNEHDYWWMLEKMVKYSWLLQECTNSGVQVDLEALEDQIVYLTDRKTEGTAKFIELAKIYIDRLERTWKEDRATKYTMDSARQRFLSNYDMQKKFNISSDKDKRELFYDSMGLPIVQETEGKKGSTALEAIKLAIRQSGKENLNELLEAYEQAETSETLLNSFAKPWLKSVIGGRLHPRFNPCGTVSYRLSGFKPYLLNAPFDQKELMSCLTCDDGWEGLHADFTSIEPAITAHYSQDLSLLRVFKEGKGDVYLSLALTLFPNDRDLREGYDPEEKATSEVKERFKKQRKIAKVIQLAVQYTGTKYTIQKNLSHAGFDMSLAEADDLVKAYWKHFHKVAVMNEALFRTFSKKGYLRNVVGRIIRVPTTVKIVRKDGTLWDKPLDRFKDLPNRFIQSSAHDILSFWVLEIAQMIKERGITAKPILIDCHDSTSWQCPKSEISALEAVFRDALTKVNEEVNMTVPVKIEMKRFNTLAGLKGEE